MLHIFFVFQINLILILHSFCKTKQNQTIVVHLSLQMNFFSLRIYIQEWIIERKLQNWIFLTPTCTGSSSVPENFFFWDCVQKNFVSGRAISWMDLFWNTEQFFHISLLIDSSSTAPTWNSFICVYWDTWNKYRLIYIFQIFQMGCTAPIWTLPCSHSWISEKILFLPFGSLSSFWEKYRTAEMAPSSWEYKRILFPAKK